MRQTFYKKSDFLSKIGVLLIGTWKADVGNQLATLLSNVDLILFPP